MQRSATAVWNGNLKAGSGHVSTESNALNQLPYTFATRFESAKGSNPEELIGAAHAGCFTMMTTALLTAAGFTATKLETKATVSLEQVDGAWTITRVALVMNASVPAITPEKFAEIANNAKLQCPVSRVLKAEITLDAKLAG